jgi:hypothetical protein
MTCLRILAARSARAMHDSSASENGGRRECRVLNRTRSLVCEKWKHTSIVTTGRPNISAFPARWFYGLLRALPGDRAFLPPSPAGSSIRKLDISVGISGPHDFAVRFASAPVLRTQSVHRIPRSTFVTTRNAPPDERGTGLALLLFLPKEKAKYFLQESWT